jgi:hypothetical protein
VVLSGSEERANSISGDFFFNSNSAVDIHQLLEVEILYINSDVAVCIFLGRCGLGAKGGGCLGYGN